MNGKLLLANLLLSLTCTNFGLSAVEFLDFVRKLAKKSKETIVRILDADSSRWNSLLELEEKVEATGR